MLHKCVLKSYFFASREVTKNKCDDFFSVNSVKKITEKKITPGLVTSQIYYNFFQKNRFFGCFWSMFTRVIFSNSFQWRLESNLYTDSLKLFLVQFWKTLIKILCSSIRWQIKIGNIFLILYTILALTSVAFKFVSLL
jgi:hypothetical protein